ncbi:MAG: MarR family transcriptional regulator [Planctomycetota bacterium]
MSEDVLLEVENKFIENWGDISGLWGVNRTIGRIQALLFLSSQPLDMENIGQRLQISHGNASGSIRDLLAWGVIRKVHVAGERRTLYEAEQDPWTWFHTCIRERRRREVVPVLESMTDTQEAARNATKSAKGADKKEMQQTQDRIEKFTKFTEEFVGLMDSFLAVGSGPMGKALRTVAKLMPKGKRK